ncbi:GNAT family N-acetyltransferase [Actinoplanes sp. NPDC049548]|uniref:GNAT family N-acetyltransferase n=1 Tax=Actinoplanes sp. NPDC049548 TaxID=3155152 RepID=UPI00341D19D2
MTIETERLELRPISTEDLPGFLGLHADPEVSRFIGRHDAESAARRLREAEESWAASGYGMFAVLERRTGEFLGRCGLVHWPELDETEIGWALHRQAWGRGYATEAARACIAWTFANTPLTRITAMINPANPRSRAVAERLGMTWSRSTPFHGAVVDVYELRKPRVTHRA